MTTRSDAYDRRQREAGEMTMVEKVARAIDGWAWHESTAWANREDAQRQALEMARAAIAVLREPSEGMMLAGEPEQAVWEHMSAADVWRNMIDAALAEHDAERLPADARGVE